MQILACRNEGIGNENNGKSSFDTQRISCYPDREKICKHIKRQTGCKIYAPFLEKTWIEDIQKQFQERPIPNFFRLLPESVKIDYELNGGEIIGLEDELEIHPLQTSGHSHGSMSYILNDEMIFMGDAIPAPNDLPIFTDYKASIRTIEQMESLSEIPLFCPA